MGASTAATAAALVFARQVCRHLARLRADPCLSPAEGRMVAKWRQEGGAADAAADLILQGRTKKPGAQARVQQQQQAARTGAGHV